MSGRMGACRCETGVRGAAALSKCACEWGRLIDALLHLAYSDSAAKRVTTAENFRMRSSMLAIQAHTAAVSELTALSRTRLNEIINR